MKKTLIPCMAAIVVIVCAVLLSWNENRTMLMSEDTYTIGVVTKSSTSEYWMSVCSGMQEAAEELGLEVIILSPDSERDEEVQKKLAVGLLERGVDALAISPINSYDNSEYIELAKEKGILVVACDTGFENEDIPYIGIDNVDAGYRLAQVMSEELGHTGEVGIVTGDLNQQGHRQRLEGFLDYMKQEADMNVSFVESGYGNLQMSKEDIDKIRQEYPAVKGIVTTSAVTALGIMEEMEKDSVKVVSIDAQTDALTAVKEGKMAALIAQSGYSIGYETIQYIANRKDGRQKAADKILDAELLTSQNIDSYLQELQREEVYGEERWQYKGGRK